MPARDRDGKLRKAVQEIGGAVQRVDDPDIFVAALAAAFLGQDAVIRVGLVDRLDYQSLGRAIDLRDEVVAALLAGCDPATAIEIPHDQFAGTSRCADGDIDKGMHDPLPPQC